MPQHYVYRFRAELKDYEPKIWRRFEINGERTMAELGYALMLMFEMQASHLFCIVDNANESFRTTMREIYEGIGKEETPEIAANYESMKNNRYELADEEAVEIIEMLGHERLVEADRVTINREVGGRNWQATMFYDYGDGWEVELVLEECEKQEISLTLLPRVLEGEGYGIIEDVGGVGGLEEFAKAMKKSKGKAYEEFRGWLGIDHLDMEAFDRDDMNFRLKKLIRVYRDMYEHRLEPTEQSYKLLYREYKERKGSDGGASASRGWAPPPKA